MKPIYLNFVLGLLLSTPLLAQENCPEGETIHVVQDLKKLNVINNHDCQNQEIFIAIPKNQEPSNFNVAVTQNATTFLMEIKDRKKMINGTLYSYNKVVFGGDFKIGKSFRFNGGAAYDRKTNILDITHNHEYAIYKLDMNRFTIEPSIHQYARFFRLPVPDASLSETNFQPASFGVFVRKQKANGKEFKVGVTAGPSMNILNSPMGSSMKLQGNVNLRLSIPL